MRILVASKEAAILIVVYMAITFGIIAGSWYASWQYVLQHQWISQPSTHYEWWQFFFAADQAWPWLWYTNFTLWIIITSAFALIVSTIICLLLIR